MSRARPLPPAFSRTLPVHAVCTGTAARPPSHLPAHTSSRIVCLPCDSVVRVGVQPAAAFRHVHRHKHGGHVSGVLSACPQPSVGPPPVHVLPLAPPQPHALPPPARTSSRIVCSPFDSAESGVVQPAADLRHVQRHGYGRHVPSALTALPGPLPLVGPSACAPLEPPQTHALMPPGPHLTPHRVLSFRLGRKRRRSTSRWALSSPMLQP